MQATLQIIGLGQSGVSIAFRHFRILIDPYLSDSVADRYGSAFTRRVPIQEPPSKCTNVDLVLITHEHLDHLDPDTLRPLALASPQARFVAPVACHHLLAACGIATDRLIAANESALRFDPGIEIRAVPAAHPEIERDAGGNLTRVGYLLRMDSISLYHAGDTSITHALLEAIANLGPITVALLPVNERNYFRDQMDILGNMSVREAFSLAKLIGAQTVVPLHWDMFTLNSVQPEEIRVIHEREFPGHSLTFLPLELAVHQLRDPLGG